MEGVVDSVRIFQTHLHAPDNRTIILPNSQITASPIVNHSLRGGRRLDVAMAVGYDDDLGIARTALLEVARANPRVRAEPAPDVVVSELTDAKVVLQLRAWVSPDDLPAVRAELQEAACSMPTSAQGGRRRPGRRGEGQKGNRKWGIGNRE